MKGKTAEGRATRCPAAASPTPGDPHHMTKHRDHSGAMGRSSKI
jgi:hypothetical protein